MNYSQSLRYLDSFLNFEKMTLTRSPRWNLERMKFLLSAADHPEKTFFPIIIVGTKGKGSTGFMLNSILTESGIPSGFYSSPHLETPRERIRIQGRMISEQQWAEDMSVIQRALSRCVVPERLGQVTYFEIMTLLAVLAFKRKGVQVGIFEAGMGGRWDAVNAMDARLVIVTPIHLDHEAVLGNTIAKIAAEKAAVIRPGSDVVISPQTEKAMEVIRAAIYKKKAQEHIPKIFSLSVGLRGDFQRTNASSAVCASALLGAKFGFKVTLEGISKGVLTCDWPGRFEVFRRKGVDWVLDAAHNPISIEALVRNLKQGYANRPRTLIFGTSKDKKSESMLKILGSFFTEVILVRAENNRSAEIEPLMIQAKKYFGRIYPIGSVCQAMRFAQSRRGVNGLITVTGSFYVIGEARRQLKK